MAQYKSDFLNILDQRGFIHQCSDFEGLDDKLAEGPQSAYIGFDATADSLHAGSLLPIMMLYWLQQTGHKPITLMGGGTTRVGDPSGKDESRKMLDDTAINANIAGIEKIFGKFLKYGSDETDALMVNNDDWLQNLNYIEFLRDYGPHFTINRMLTFESVKLRLEREQPLTFLEFNYMILQAYDFVELRRRHGTILQMGGSDQWGNIINGVELWRRKNTVEFNVTNAPLSTVPIGGAINVPLKDPIFGLTTPLLTTASGAKMGKTADGAIWLNEERLPPYNYYQYWRNTEDADVGRFLRLFTTLKLDEIARLEKLQGQEINEAKKILAFEATRLCHGELAATEAAQTAQQVFEQGGVGGDLPSVAFEESAFESGITFIDASCAAGLTASKGEARRIIKQGGARVNDNQISDEAFMITRKDLIGEGYVKISTSRKKHALVKVRTDQG